VILLFKYQKLRLLGRELGRRLFAGLKSEESLWWGASGLVPVPLHPRKKRSRGFNQSELLARELADRSGIPFLPELLKRIRSGPPQTTLSGEERRSNLRGAFAMKRRSSAAGLTLILVDDVFTTGATLTACSHTLLEAGAEEVRAVTLARA
jgi:ComF family protein